MVRRKSWFNFRPFCMKKNTCVGVIQLPVITLVLGLPTLLESHSKLTHLDVFLQLKLELDK